MNKSKTINKGQAYDSLAVFEKRVNEKARELTDRQRIPDKKNGELKALLIGTLKTFDWDLDPKTLRVMLEKDISYIFVNPNTKAVLCISKEEFAEKRDIITLALMKAGFVSEQYEYSRGHTIRPIATLDGYGIFHKYIYSLTSEHPQLHDIHREPEQPTTMLVEDFLSLAKSVQQISNKFAKSMGFEVIEKPTTTIDDQSPNP